MWNTYTTAEVIGEDECQSKKHVHHYTRERVGTPNSRVAQTKQMVDNGLSTFMSLRLLKLKEDVETQRHYMYVIFHCMETANIMATAYKV